MGLLAQGTLVVRRGEIWWATLPEPSGSEPGYYRPVLIVQDNRFNASRISTVVVVSLTSNLRLANAPGNVFLDRDGSGLPQDSVINVSQVLTIDKSFLTEQGNSLPRATQELVDHGLRLVMGL